MWGSGLLPVVLRAPRMPTWTLTRKAGGGVQAGRLLHTAQVQRVPLSITNTAENLGETGVQRQSQRTSGKEAFFPEQR